MFKVRRQMAEVGKELAGLGRIARGEDVFFLNFAAADGTPLFLTAGGLLMERGGPNSHDAVVAREYGIPALVGVPDATTRLRTGQKVTVDGGPGTVAPGA